MSQVTICTSMASSSSGVAVLCVLLVVVLAAVVKCIPPVFPVHGKLLPVCLVDGIGMKVALDNVLETEFWITGTMSSIWKFTVEHLL